MNKYALWGLVLLSNFLQAQKKDITIAELWEQGLFSPVYVEGFNFSQKGGYYTRLVERGTEVKEYSLSTGEPTRSLFLAPKGMRVLDYSLSEDENRLLITTEMERIYRHSFQANFKVWDLKTQSLTSVSDKGKQRYATFNPKADKVAFVRDNNLFYINLETKNEVQITRDGAVNRIINGATDWVYEEEFSIDRAFFWSPDGRYIAFLRFDETLVKEVTLTYFNNELYPIESKFKYPKAGELNAVVTVHIYDLESQETIEVKVKGEVDQYIPRLKWTPDNRLCITRLNRLQNELGLLLAEPKTGKTELLLEEKSKTYIDMHDHPYFVGKDRFVWQSDADGYNHLYLYNLKGKQLKQLTKGNFDVTQFYGLDEKREEVYFQAAISTPMNREVARVGIKSGKIEVLSRQEGANSAQFSKNYEFMVLAHSSIAGPGTHNVYEIQGKEVKLIRTIEDNAALQTLLQQYNFGKHEFIKIPNGQGDTLNAWRILPPDFDPNKKYPVLMYAYGGPGHQTVLNAWDSRNHIWFQMLAQQGYVVVSVDNRGTGARGAAFKKATYLQLGKLEAQDQIEAGRYLAKQPYVDAQRIGIFGWSFGGYLSSLCLAKGADVFKMAIAVAPVINWKWYDTIYTERYMRTPQENNEGYEQNSPINFAKDIKGSYLLVHGITDDNVHFQNAAEMARVLVENNIPFDEGFYPNKNHGISGGYTRSHLYRKMTKFIQDNL